MLVHLFQMVAVVFLTEKINHAFVLVRSWLVLFCHRQKKCICFYFCGGGASKTDQGYNHYCQSVIRMKLRVEWGDGSKNRNSNKSSNGSNQQ